jgi:putative methyltransferase (TIGR04325 family)
VKLFRILYRKLLEFLYFFKLQLLTKRFKSWEKCENYCIKQNLRKFNYCSTLYSSSLISKNRIKIFFEKKNQIGSFQIQLNQTLVEFIGFFLNKYKYFPKILDIGGGLGDNYFYLKKIFSVNLVYDVVENPNLIKLIKKKKLDHINFFSSLSEVDNYDLIYSSGTIQCIKNYDSFFSTILKKKKFKYIVLTRNNFGENHSYVAQYTNDGYVPVQQVSYKKLAILIKKNHCKIIREIPIKESILEGNLGKNSYGKDLVIAKI